MADLPQEPRQPAAKFTHTDPTRGRQLIFLVRFGHDAPM